MDGIIVSSSGSVVPYSNFFLHDPTNLFYKIVYEKTKSETLSGETEQIDVSRRDSARELGICPRVGFESAVRKNK